MLLSFKIKKQIISRTDREKPVADSKNYLRAAFDLPSDWEGVVTAVFKYQKQKTDKGDTYEQILDSDATCAVPWEVIKAPGFFVSCFCGNLITANKVSVPVIPSGYEEGKTPAPPTPDVYTRLAALAQSAKDTADSVRADADSGAFDGAPGTTDYTELENRPRALFTPRSAYIPFAEFTTGIYDVTESFTLLGVDGGLLVKAGAILCIKVGNGTCSGAILGDTDSCITVFKKGIASKSLALKNLMDYPFDRFISDASLAQTTGNDTQKVMSQNAVTAALANIHPVSLDENGQLICQVDDNATTRTFILQGREKGNNEPLIPQLSSNNGTNGYVINSGGYHGGNASNAYYAFDNNASTNCQYYGEGQSNGYIGYMFHEEVCIKKMVALLGNCAASNSFTVKPQYYNGVGWVDIGQDFVVSGYKEPNSGTFEIVFNHSIVTTGFRLLSPTTKVSGTNIITYSLQLYN